MTCTNIFQWSQRRHKLRIARWTWRSGAEGHPRVTTRFSLALRPIVFRWRWYGERDWQLIVLGVALHFHQSARPSVFLKRGRPYGVTD